MQFIIIEWEVYNITKDPLALGLIGLVEIIPQYQWPFLQVILLIKTRKKNYLFMQFLLFNSVICIFVVTSKYCYSNFSSNKILYAIYF